MEGWRERAGRAEAEAKAVRVQLLRAEAAKVQVRGCDWVVVETGAGLRVRGCLCGAWMQAVQVIPSRLSHLHCPPVCPHTPDAVEASTSLILTISLAPYPPLQMLSDLSAVRDQALGLAAENVAVRSQFEDMSRAMAAMLARIEEMEGREGQVRGDWVGACGEMGKQGGAGWGGSQRLCKGFTREKGGPEIRGTHVTSQHAPPTQVAVREANAAAAADAAVAERDAAVKRAQVMAGELQRAHAAVVDARAEGRAEVHGPWAVR